MRILLSSHFFHPSVGGIEQVSLALATQFARAGHTVKVITTTPQSDRSNFQFDVVRRPSTPRLLELVRWSEVVFHNNISLRTWWPLVFIRRPWVIAHHTWIARTDFSLGLRDRLKHFLTRFATNIAISQPIAGHLTVPSTVIGNPYRDELFRRDSLAKRDIELIFVGRLVPDKGVDILVNALKRLRERKLFPKLTIVGSGPDLTRLRTMVEQLQLGHQVVFLGTRTGAALVEQLNRHRVIVVPSRWQEPFGLVALEGIACGCRAIVAKSGGLLEAAGRHTVVFENESDLALADAIERMLKDAIDWEDYWRSVEEHLRPHHAGEVARRYLEVITKASLSRKSREAKRS
jgi:glycogen(starch) synthase